MYIIGVIHWLNVCFILLYPLLFKNYIIDIIYIINITITVLGWFLFKGECWLSYYVKKYQNTDYNIGDNVFDHPDMRLVIPIDEKYLSNFFIYSTFVTIILLYIVNNRSRIINVNIIYIISLIYLYYIFYVRKFCSRELYDKLSIEYYCYYLNPLFSLILFLVFLLLIKKLLLVIYK